ncbi:hypothetical protein O6H91_09G090500 [Diphasiastrum complanatum]|uniref:Uncharacterized protein n=1 Tax=Diphasiastrum complanatum TaxID=34168 RepID=A0ACC2CRT9_DIPCM|nr:hypothetical protein O6H91_09G090500 [Diphasiastrum complanatum]
MSVASGSSWLRGLRSSSLFRPPPPDRLQRQEEVLAYVELFIQCASESFVDDITELARSHYPQEVVCLLDDVLATIVLKCPEHAHAILHPLLSCVIDGTLTYNKKNPPFGSFVTLFSPSSERDVTEQWVLACGEVLRILTHYNRPIYKAALGTSITNIDCSSGTSGHYGSSNISQKGNEDKLYISDKQGKMPQRLLTPWITDSLLAAPLGIRSDYFRWCGGVVGKYATGRELQPPTTAVGGRGLGKQPQLLSSTPRWAVANGAAVISSVCDDEVSRYETADLTAAAVPALLLPPPATAFDEHLVAGLPPLEPYAHLFHRYYGIATPGATQKLLLGLFEAPSSWAPDALDAAVQLVELLRAAEDFSSSFKLPGTWFHLHFLRPIGTAMAMRSGRVAAAAAALLFRLFSQPALLFPRGHTQDVHILQPLYGPPTHAALTEKNEAEAVQAIEEATAKGMASLISGNGADVEWRICAIWEAAYGLLSLDSSAVDLPDLVVSTPLQPPVLSWSLFRPLLRVLEHLPRASPSHASMRRIFSATASAILQRVFPVQDISEPKNGRLKGSQAGGGGAGAESVRMAELRAMVHGLFMEPFLSPDVASQLLSDALTICHNHDALWQGSDKKGKKDGGCMPMDIGEARQKLLMSESRKNRGAVATFDAYVVAAVCALTCELQLCSFSSVISGFSFQLNNGSSGASISSATGHDRPMKELGNLLPPAALHSKRLMDILERLLVLEPTSTLIQSSSSDSSDILAAAVVAAHLSKLMGRSRTCMQSLIVTTRCNWDPGLSAKSFAVLSLVERNLKVLNDALSSAQKSVKGSSKRRMVESGSDMIQPKSQQKEKNGQDRNQKEVFSTVPVFNPASERASKSFCNEIYLPFTAADITNLMCKPAGIDKGVDAMLRVILVKKPDLAVAAVPLLWQRLMISAEIPISCEGTSAKQGWRQVVEALCYMVMAFPMTVTPAVISQAERGLQPWNGKDAQKQRSIWRLNSRIICLLAEFLRLRNYPEVVTVAASASDLLQKATDGLCTSEDVYTMPQLELLEAVLEAAQSLVLWDKSAQTPAELLLSLLKVRIFILRFHLLTRGCIMLEMGLSTQLWSSEIRRVDNTKRHFEASVLSKFSIKCFSPVEYMVVHVTRGLAISVMRGIIS